MAQTNEIAILVSLYSTSHPRSCALALQGDANAIHALEMEAFKDETRERCALALGTMSDRGWKIGAMHNRCHALAKRAKSWRARVILNTMARIALGALPESERC